MGQDLVVCDAHRHAARVRALGLAERGLQRRLAGADDGPLHAMRQRGRQGGEHEVEPLLRREAAQHRHERRRRVGREAQLELQRRLAGRLAVETIGVVAHGKRRVGRGRPDRAVDAVEDAAHVGAAAADHAVQAGAELGGRDLARVRGAHGGDAVGELQTGLHARHLAVELQPAGRHVARRQAEEREVAVREHALVGQVVHGEHRGGGIRRRVGMHVGAGRRRVPVVGVQHVGLPSRVERAAAELRGRPAQQREALQVVGPVEAVAVLVGAAAAPVEQRRVDHVGRHAAAGQAAQAQRDGRGTERRADLGHLLLLRHRLCNGGQPGQQQADVGAGAREGGWQGGGDVG